MTFEVAIENPPLRVERDGTVRIGLTRVTLDTIVAAYLTGATAEQIVAQYPSLSLAEAYEVIGYYLRHAAQVDEYLRARMEGGEAIRTHIESDPTTQQIRERLIGRRNATDIRHRNES